MPTQLIILLVSMIPVLELRGAIPVAVGVYNMPILDAFFWAVLGNIIPIVFILLGLDLLINKLLIHRIYFFNRFFTWLFERTQRNHSRKFERWKELALVILVAIPLPLTGAWTGALAAFVFGIPLKRAFPLIGLGVAIAGAIVTLITVGIINLPFI